MFKRKDWIFTGTSGTEYRFTLHPKSEGIPATPGVFILAYTHPCGHMAGWRVQPLFIGHAGNMRVALDAEVEPARDQSPLWNSNFVLSEADRLEREKCVRDLGLRESWHG